MIKFLLSSSTVSRTRYRACNSTEIIDDLFGWRSIKEELSMTAATAALLSKTEPSE